MKTNINSPASFYGPSDTEWHGFTPARHETESEMLLRLENAENDIRDEIVAYNDARLAGEITYTKKYHAHP